MDTTDSSSTVAPSLPGYTFGKQIYLGTRTIVYRAVDTRLERSVVIKTLRNEHPSFGELAQFRNQYVIAQNINSLGIVQPLTLEPFGNGYALVMEDEEGIALDRYLQKQSLAVAEVLAIALQMADILHDLGQHRVVHKDIKPANLLIQPDSKTIKLIDFSIASLLPRETQEIQSPNVLEGTLAYLAPEQTGRMNRGIDYRTDFYSLGITLYQLLTGNVPFTSDDPLELMHCHMAQVPVPVNQVNPEVPAIVGAIVDKLMAKNAEERYQSALGLKYDLGKCFQQWQAIGDIDKFPLGERDLSDRFLIPEKLYGRETEVQTLLDAFERIANGTRELMLVAGFSGIGKTAVVNEMHKPIVRQRGYFIKGKYDQFNRNIPFSAFVQAFRDLMGQLLSESDEALAHWRTSVLEIVGDNGQVLIDVIPELEHIIGEQPAAIQLEGSAAQNRFNLLFQRFIAIFTTPEHPLVLFLDDLQWADSASLNLIKVLMNESETGYLLLLGAYRDNEVFPAHPLTLTLEELKKEEASLSTITLAPLPLQEVNRLVAETLHCQSSLAQPLTELVYQKTLGNPFFTTQFLKGLYDEQLIVFDQDLGHWKCDLVQVREAALTDDVVKFMAGRLQKLSEQTQNILKLAACIGNQFDLATLAVVSEKGEEEVASNLWGALKEGLILPISDAYKFFQGEGKGTEKAVDVAIDYRFLHDRVQQAAYSLIGEEQKSATHLNIGQLLLAKNSEEEREKQLFDIVNHLNLGLVLIVESAEKMELAQLNFMAARKAKSATAYDAALKYLKVGEKLLPEDDWNNSYELTYSFYKTFAEVEYLTGRYADAADRVTLVFSKAATLLDRAAIYPIKLQILTAQTQFSKTIDTGLSYLKELQVVLEENPPQNQFLQVEFLRQLPLMVDPRKLAAMNILYKLIGPAYIQQPDALEQIINTMLHLSIEYGNAKESTYGYALYGMALCSSMEDISQGYQLGQMAVELLEILDASNICECAVLNIFGNCIRSWKQPARDDVSLGIGVRGFYSGLESGDIETAGYSIIHYCLSLLFLGLPLSNLGQKFNGYLQTLKKLKQDYSSTYLEVGLSVILTLQEKQLYVDEYIRESQRLESDLISSGNRTTLFLFYVVNAMLLYMMSRTEEAFKYSSLAVDHASTAPGLLTVNQHNFYYSLSLFGCHDSVLESGDNELWGIINKNQEKMKVWTDHAPANFLQQYYLIEAERHRVLGEKSEAMELYDQAIRGAKENGYAQEEALANELAAKFYLDWDKERVAQEYLINAYYCYARWGAKAKVQLLEQKYPTLLAPILQQRDISLSATETIPSTVSWTAPTTLETQVSTSGGTSISASLDLTTVLKASQALSSKIQLDKLLATLLQTVMENAGADKGALLIPHQDEWFVEAIASIEKPVAVESIALDQSESVPHGVIHTVKRTVESIVIIDAGADPTLAMDTYIRKTQPKSVLCTPILQQGKLAAILYLENQVTAGAFTSDRIELLNFLCAQAAISLENARLYEQTQAYAHQLEQSQLQIVQSEKMASLGNLVAGVGHEINNPIGFLNGSIGNVKDYIQELLHHFSLYEKYYPMPVDSIQQSAEEIDLSFLKEDLTKLLESMTQATTRITSISKSLRTFSRADTQEKISADLHEGLDSTLLILKYRLKANDHRPQIKVLKEYGDLPEIDCFPGQLNQVFMNILANAIDMFDDAAQHLSFTELKAQPQIITIRTVLTGSDRVEVHIQDNGQGIEKEIQSQIFDHLFTTKTVGKGTGLGLAIAQQIIEEKHGGKLAFHSEWKVGTTFSIALPI